MNLDNIHKLTDATLIGHLGIKVLTISDSEVIASMPVNERTIQPFHILHGGASLALGETVASVGSLVLCSDNEVCYGLQLSANHVGQAVEGDTVVATGTMVQCGKSIHVWNVDIHSEATGKLLTTMRVTNKISKRR